jgi:hypothetical protein
MAAYYTVVQYVPDPIADERINVGVIVFNADQIRSRFLQNWDRVSRFAQGDISHVQEFADWVRGAGAQLPSRPATITLPGYPEPFRLNEQTIRRMAAEWSNSIQLTGPQPSLEDPDVLLLRMAQAHLREPVRRTRAFRDRQAAARIAVRTVRDAVAEHYGSTMASKTVHSNYQIGGKLVENFRVDLAITNGRIYVASQTLSFETYNMAELDRQMRDVIYTLRDVGELSAHIRTDLVALPPRTDMRNHRQAEERFRHLSEMCEQIGARLVLENDVPEWADEIAELVGTEIVGHDLQAARA